MLTRSVIVSALALAMSALVSAQAATQNLHWQPWSDSAFERARVEHKFVLLDLEAVWCHWCHVMDDVTYRDPVVTRLLNQRYILIKVDQDSRPDISNRYQDWGWPATIVFASDGSEIVKRQGYIPPRPMSSLLQAIIDDPSPGPSVDRPVAFHSSQNSSILPSLLTRIKSQYEMQYDKPVSGWGFGHKYLDRDSVEYAMRLSATGNLVYAKRLRDTLHNAISLIDPVWGGMYQYSVDGVWSEPHYEKLISVQADAMREYSLSYAQSLNPEDLRAAQSIHRYVTSFLTSTTDGVFFVSQDADLHDGEENAPYFKLADSERRAKGIPRIDTHVYSRENGSMIAALCEYYAATGDGTSLFEAQRAARWISHHRNLPGGGFRHDEVDTAGPYLGDTLAMGQAYLALYNVTGDHANLESAVAAARFIAANFTPVTPGSGFITSRRTAVASFAPHPDRDENIALVRFASLLAVATGDRRLQLTATEAMRYLAAPSIAIKPLSAGILLASLDAVRPPIHVTVVGLPSDPATIALHTAALRSISSHELIEIRDPSVPSPMTTKIAYPRLSRAALFLCTASSCSSPVFHPNDVRSKIQRAQLDPAP